MSLNSLFPWLNTDRKTQNSRQRRPAARRARLRRSLMARFERLEDRALLSTVTVENLNDSGAGSLRDALASGATTIDFAHGLHGTIQLGSELAINGSVNIDGPGANHLAVSGNDASRVFDIGGSANVSISGLTITDGQATTGGGILLEGSASLSLNKSTLSDNEALGSLAGSLTMPDGDGGGIEDNSSGSLTVTNSDFDGNQAVARGPNAPPPSPAGYIIALGGAIDLSLYSTGTATIRNSTFDGNQALGGVAGASAGGGALSDSSLVFSTTTANMTVTGCSLSDNQAIGAAGGGGVNNSVNFGSGQGGGINNFANLVVDDSTLSDNLAQGSPLAPGVAPAQVLLANTSVAGGGIFELTNNIPASMTVTDSTLSGNHAVGGDGTAGSAGAVGEGGGISVVVFSSAVVTGCTLEDNVAQGGAGGSGAVGGAGAGGGLDTAVGGIVTVSDTALIHNQAVGGAGGTGSTGGEGVGGAIDVDTDVLAGYSGLPSTLSLADSLVVGNQAVGGAGGSGDNGGNGQGGGVSALMGGTANIGSSIIVANQAQGGAGGVGGNGGNGLGGGLYVDPGATLNLTSSVVAGNLAEGGEAGAGGTDGQGVGGGVYNVGTFTNVSSLIRGNHASTSNDDIYP
jgi:hypothetical protein